MQEGQTENVQENGGCLAMAGRPLVGLTHQYVFLLLVVSLATMLLAVFWWNTTYGLYALFAWVPMFYFIGLGLMSARMRAVAIVGAVFAFFALIAASNAFHGFQSHHDFFMAFQGLEIVTILLGVRRIDPQAAPLVPRRLVPQITNAPQVNVDPGETLDGLAARWGRISNGKRILLGVAVLLGLCNPMLLFIPVILFFRWSAPVQEQPAAGAEQAAVQADAPEEAQPVPGAIRLPGPTPAHNGDRVPGLPEGTPGPDDFVI